MERFNEKANALAHEYLRLKDLTITKAGVSRLEEIEKLLDKGIGGKLKEQLDAEAKRLRKEEGDRNSAFMKLEDVKKELLELTAELAPNLDLPEDNFFPYDNEYEPISETYFSALTDIFFGKPSSSIQFKVATFSKEGIKIESTDSSPLEVLEYVIMITQETAKKMLGVRNAMDKHCELLKQNEYAFIVLGTLIKEGRGLEIRALKEITHREDKEYKELVRGDTYDKELVTSVAYLMSEDWEYGLVKEYDGKYEATDFGERVWRICNAEANKEEGDVRARRAGMSNPNLNIQKVLKFFKK